MYGPKHISTKIWQYVLMVQTTCFHHLLCFFGLYGEYNIKNLTYCDMQWNMTQKGYKLWGKMVLHSYHHRCSFCVCLSFYEMLEPALLLGDVRCLNPVMRSQLLDGYREVIADGAFKKEERCGDLGNTCCKQNFVGSMQLTWEGRLNLLCWSQYAFFVIALYLVECILTPDSSSIRSR